MFESVNQIIALLMLIEGLGFGAAAYLLYTRKRTKLAGCQRAWGEVVTVNEQRDPEGGITRHPVIRYLSLTGHEVTFASKFGSSHWKVKPGDRLEILYHPEQPAEAEVVNFMAQWALPLVFAIVAGGSLLFAPVMFWLLRR
ncbi:MAG TPA: DUF3592 domain-containing protein [Dongiaceae bacterium]|nr:DUF3592 domain-containing protein [Dongiaceae bacterium]